MQDTTYNKTTVINCTGQQCGRALGHDGCVFLTQHIQLSQLTKQKP